MASLDHVALLVRSAEKSAAACAAAGYAAGPAEDFPGEGTREVYVGAGGALLLLMEAIGPGPYANALAKRGPGLHHIAVHVASVAAYVEGLAGSGWLLHPASLHTLAHRKTAYLARPGLHALIEVQESAPKPAADRFVSEVLVAGEPGHQRLLDALGVPGLRLAGQDGPALVIGGKRVAVASL